MIELLGRAGCVSIEAGVESLTPEGRDALDKDCRMGTEELTERLILAKRCVPFVQANLIETPLDDPSTVGQWREEMRGVRDLGQRSGSPVPVSRLAGLPQACGALPTIGPGSARMSTTSRQFRDFSEIQDERPLPIVELEARAA